MKTLKANHVTIFNSFKEPLISPPVQMLDEMLKGNYEVAECKPGKAVVSKSAAGGSFIKVTDNTMHYTDMIMLYTKHYRLNIQ